MKKKTEFQNTTALETPKPMGRRERRSIETREKIFHIAINLFAERGFNATTIDAIAEGADIGKGTFFNYFENKESILLQYREIQMGRISDFVKESINSDEPIGSLMYKLALTMTTEQQKNHNIFRSQMVAIFTKKSIRAKVVEGMKRNVEMLAEFFAIRKQSGEIRSALPALEIARTFQKMIFGTMLIWSMDQDRTLEEQLNYMVDVFVKGIQAE